MKKVLTFLLSWLIFSPFVQAQSMPGMFYHDLNSTTTTSPCVIDSSFYVIKYGGVERFSSAFDTVDYLWNRFYGVTKIVRAAQSSMVLLKGGLVYRYFPANDSMVSISGSLPGHTVTDIDASDSAIWAIVNFDVIGRYTDNTGWQIISLGSSFGPSHILAQSDSSVYLADNTSVKLYTPSGLSAQTAYTFSINASLTEWVKDTAGNAWILADHTLIELTQNFGSTIFNQLNRPLTSGDGFTHLTTNGIGSIFVSTWQGNIYRYKSSSWAGFNLQLNSQVQTMAADPTDRIVYLQTDNDSIYILNDSLGTYPNYYFNNMPYQHIQAISPAFIATDQGIFQYGTYQFPYMDPIGFKDTAHSVYADDVTCFVVNGQNIDSGYGTHHGVFNTTTPINNASLPDTNINYLYYALGSYYIGTDKGLCIFNQVVYTSYDTSNSGLPSNKITFIISYQSPYSNVQELWVGTDRGIALYTNGQWTRFDTSVVHIPSFNVTSILPCPFYYMNADSTVWITTLGSGMVKLRRDSTYILFNTQNGGIKDDSLYYVTQNEGCEYTGSGFIGTQSHGIAWLQIPGNTFIYDTLGFSNGVTVTYKKASMFATIGQYRGETLLTTDQGLDYIGMCLGVGIKTGPSGNSNLIWYQTDDSRLRVQIPDGFAAPAEFSIYDMMGRKVTSSIQDIPNTATAYLDISGLTSGMYILQASDPVRSSQTKIIISK